MTKQLQKEKRLLQHFNRVCYNAYYILPKQVKKMIKTKIKRVYDLELGAENGGNDESSCIQGKWYCVLRR